FNASIASLSEYPSASKALRISVLASPAAVAPLVPKSAPSFPFNSSSRRSAVFLPMPTFSQADRLLQGHGAGQIIHRHAGQDGKGSTGAHTGYLDKLLENVALFRGAETKQQVGIFAHRQVGEQHDLFSYGGKIVEGTHRHIDFIAYAVTVD